VFYRRFSCWHEGVELPFEVTTLDVAVPLVLTLDGDAAIFNITTVVEHGPEVGRSDACRWYMWWGQRVCTTGGLRATDRRCLRGRWSARHGRCA
jgi:hypothetical protein